ncbi:MAG: hypothetical protein MJ097_00440 [Dorea sp.]|nr:hypothetical protein [Dorea sp.]
MKLITDIDDDVEFLAALYNVAELIDIALQNTGIMEIRKRMPDNLPVPDKNDSKEVAEEKAKKGLEMIREQSKKNILEMARVLMKEKPQEAIKVIQSVFILEEIPVIDEETHEVTGTRMEEFPKGMALFSAGIKAFTNPEVLDFFTSLMQLETTFSRRPSSK